MTLTHLHNWHVVGTELSHVCLIVQCLDCGDAGIVRNPTKAEWGDAFDAPSNPYEWNDPKRVVPLADMHGVKVAQDEVFSLN